MPADRENPSVGKMSTGAWFPTGAMPVGDGRLESAIPLRTNDLAYVTDEVWQESVSSYHTSTGKVPYIGLMELRRYPSGTGGPRIEIAFAL
jgi:hypothetical protein